MAPAEMHFPGGTAVQDGESENAASSETAKTRFTQLVLPYLPDAYALARSLTGNRADAEDVVQDACLRALRAVGSSTITNARAWVLTIVHNTAYTWLRKNRPAAVMTVDDLEAVEQAQTGSTRDEQTPEAAVIAQAHSKQLETAIQKLPAPYRAVLVLRDVEGLSYREIAEVTGIAIGTVMSRLARARSRLIAEIGNAAR